MPATDALAAILADRFVIERLIGGGCTTNGYVIRDLRHIRRVALIVLRPDLAAPTS